jgi:kynureninase
LQYAFASQVLSHGLDPKEAIIEIAPRKDEYILRTEDILDLLANEGPSIALVLFSGVHYYTGQWFPMAAITKEAKKQVYFAYYMVLLITMLTSLIGVYMRLGPSSRHWKRAPLVA